MSTWITVVSSIGAGSFGSIVVFFGSRYVARSSRRAAAITTAATAQVENRKVDLDEFREFKVTYREELESMKSRLKQAEAHSDKALKLLQEAINHIDILRGSMVQAGLTPGPLPSTLRAVRWEAFARRTYNENGTPMQEASE